MSLAHSISGFNRRRKWRLFNRFFEVTPTQRVLDVGFSDREYSANDNFLEKKYPYPSQIVALGVEEASEFKKRYPEVKVMTYDGKEFPFPDQSFDVAWSNAVLEHVGDISAQVNFLKEVKRVAKRAFITTPNRYFPIEPHTRTPLLHYLPKRWFDGYLRLIGKGWASGEYMHLLSKKQLERLVMKAGITNYQIVANRIGPFALDFVVIF